MSVSPPSSPTAIPRIRIIDHTKEGNGQENDEEQQSPVSDDDVDALTGDESAATLRGWSRSSLRDRRNQLKYAKWQEDGGRPISRPQTKDSAANPDHDETGDEFNPHWGESSIHRGRRHIKDLISQQKRRQKAILETDSEIDVLYENQRGAFFCGMPLFSSKALSQFEPPPWVDGEFKLSPVNITNAQVPDPSWQWTWRNWYVDMSRDVDEEGWEYSIFFKWFSWHGTHPWFHSFVRRRRWIRKRSRRHDHLPSKVFGDAHMMNQDYFTIHSENFKSLTSDLSSPTRSKLQSSVVSHRRKWDAEDEKIEEEIEIKDVGTLLKCLKDASVDSEKITLIRRFLDQGGEELYYFAEYISQILDYFFYENSCRILLSILKERLDGATKHRDEHTSRNEPESEEEKRYIDSLLRSVEAVDDQCKKLEFWSDIRRIGRHESHTHHDHHGWGHDWEDKDTDVSEQDHQLGSKSNGEDEDQPWEKDKNVFDTDQFYNDEDHVKLQEESLDGTVEQIPKQRWQKVRREDLELESEASDSLNGGEGEAEAEAEAEGETEREKGKIETQEQAPVEPKGSDSNQDLETEEGSHGQATDGAKTMSSNPHSDSEDQGKVAMQSKDPELEHHDSEEERGQGQATDEGKETNPDRHPDGGKEVKEQEDTEPKEMDLEHESTKEQNR